MVDAVVDILDDIFLWIYGFILAAGTCTTLVFLLALMRGRTVLAQWPFYTIVWSMTWMDVIYLTIQIFWEFPQMVAANDAPISNATMEDSKVWYKLSAVHFIIDVIALIPHKVLHYPRLISKSSDQGIIYFSLLMALNRLSVFVHSPINSIFSKDYVGITNIACWALVLVLCVCTELLEPSEEFNRTSLQFETTGSAIIELPFLKGLNTTLDYVIPFVIAAIYVIVYIAIGKKREILVNSISASSSISSSVRARPPNDRKLLFQAIIITFFLQLDNVAKGVNELYQGDGWFDYLINVVDLMSEVVNHSIHATIFLLSNPTIRSFLPSISGLQQRLRCT